MAKKTTTEEVKEHAEKESSRFTGTLRKVVLASVGAVGIAQDELTALIDRMVERGEITQKDASKLMHDVQKEVGKRRKGGQSKAEKEMEAMLDKLNIPSKADIEDLTKQVSSLSKRVEELKAEMSKTA